MPKSKAISGERVNEKDDIKWLEDIKKNFRKIGLCDRDKRVKNLVQEKVGASDFNKIIKRESTVNPKNASIILVAPNPAVDFFWHENTFEIGGGLGNLGMVFSRFGIPTVACGFLSKNARVSRLFHELAALKGVSTAHCTDIEGDCGINIFTKPEERMARIGPKISERERTKFLAYLKNVLDRVNIEKPPIIVITGSVPPSHEKTSHEKNAMARLYADIIHMVRQREAKNDLARPFTIMLDAREPYLYWALLNHPDLVYLSLNEMKKLIITLFMRDEEFKESCRLYGIRSEKELVNLANKAPAISAKYLSDRKDIPSIVVTCGSDGAWQVWRDTKKAVFCKPTEAFKKTWTVSAGDTLVAIHAIGYLNAQGESVPKISTIEEGIIATTLTSSLKGRSILNTYDDVIKNRKMIEREEFRLPSRIGLNISHVRLKSARDRIDEFLHSCKKAGCLPVIVADMDDTITLAHKAILPSAAEAIAKVVEKKMVFATLTSSSWEATNNQILNPINTGLDNTGLKKRFKPLYRKMPLLVTQGSTGYLWSNGKYRKYYGISIEKILGKINAPILNNILNEAIKRYGLNPLAGNLIEPRGSQITLFVLGNKATSEQKNEYYSKFGKGQRLEYAKWINEQFYEQGIPAQAGVGGKSSIDITPMNVDKGFGILQLSKILGIPLKFFIYFADEFGPEGSDEPVPKMGVLSINVGPAIRELVTSTWTTEKYGTDGLVEHLHQIAEFS